MNDFGAFLRSIRKRRKYSIRKLALKSGVSNPYLSMLERGIKKNPSYRVLMKLSNALSIPYQYLFFAAGYFEKPDHEMMFDVSELTDEDIEKIKNEIERLKHSKNDDGKN